MEKLQPSLGCLLLSEAELKLNFLNLLRLPSRLWYPELIFLCRKIVQKSAYLAVHFGMNGSLGKDKHKCFSSLENLYLPAYSWNVFKFAVSLLETHLLRASEPLDQQAAS